MFYPVIFILMKKFSVLMMIAFAIVLVSACTKPWTSGNVWVSGKSAKVKIKNPVAWGESVKEQIAKRNQQKASDTKKMEDNKNTDTEKGQEDTNMWDLAIDTDTEALARCLTEKGFKMYGTNRCSHCKNQKEKFGASFKKIDFIDCDAEKEACTKAGVQWYPTWVNAEWKLFPWDQSLEKLKNISWCWE